ncbi:T9SS type A sorting domain-containing protein, partial [Flavobacteriaceae bacterium]|nr:T9SS type A sorting domain-containing protein [Flavobacteriaceae bacterium]
WVADASVRTIKVTPIAGDQVLITVPVTSGAWNSVDIPLTDFTGTGFNAVSQLKFDGQFAADGTTPDPNVRSDIYLDNIYFWKAPAAAGTDATLSDLQVDSATISGFSAGTTSYTYNLLEGTTDIPQITAATTTDANAQTTITQATAIPGDATVVVTAQDGTTTQTYTVSYAYVSSPEGTWSFTPTAGAFMVGPGQGTGDYYTSTSGDVTARTCLFDDEYVFNADGSFENVLGSDTWLETWQAGVAAEGCGTPIAPHDGTNPATWSFNPSGTITIVGDGAFLGLAKVTNTAQDGSPLNNTITYIVTSISSTNMTLDINYGNGGEGWWRFLLTKQAAAGSDATLSSLEVDSTVISGFSTVTTSYTYEVAVGASIPQITAATPTDANANASITQATTIPGDATVVVTAQDGTTTQTYTVYYYYPSPTTGASAPPSRYAGDVISIFGDTYTNVAIDNYNPNWGQAGYGSANTSYDPGDGSTLLYYPNFNYQGIQLVGGHDASDMEYLHVDLFTTSSSEIKVSPINSGTGPGDALQTISHTIGSWTSVDIPIGDFLNTSVNEQMTWDNVIQMKFDGGNGTTDAIYVDNIYFWKSSACSSTTTWDGTAWSNSAPDANSYAIISGAYSTGTDGAITACVMQVDASVTIDTATDTAVSEILVTAGNTLTVDGTSSLTVTGDFTNSGGTVTLNSTEDDFSSLIVEGTATGDITYNRYVNAYDTNPDGGGWDFVCSPVTMSIADFITANGTAGANVIEILGDDYAFASYDNAAGQWDLYATDTSTGSFTTGQGYAMATNAGDGATVAFTGAMKTADQSIDIINNNGVNGVGRRWNLVSNPFPSYINGNTAAGATNFMDANAAVIDDTFLYVYGWNGSSYTIYNQTTDAFSMAPGQAFWVAAENTTATALNFTAAMRTTTGSGDFVAGPQPLTYNLELILKDESQTATTNFYFKDGLSLDLDPGYDAGAYNQSMALSTRLPQGNQETAFSINAMDVDAMQNTRVPLEIRQNAGQAFTISMADIDLPQDIYVYLEDTLNGTLTSLKDQDFELTAQSDLSGVDRFFIVFKSNSVLSSGDTLGLSALNVYKANTDSFVTIAGISPELEKLDVTLYSILGVAVKQTVLNTTTATQRVSTQGLASGLYIVQIRSGNQTTVKKNNCQIINL